jgi:hypothetical protein
MKISRREWLVAGSCAAATAVPLMAQAAEEAASTEGQLTQEQLGNLIKAMGLKATLEQTRYDFRFRSVLDGEEWNLTMSAVLSQDGNSIWVMAWLDELPKSAAEVPRTALLRLLATNDRLGKGQFFAYIATNRRFVLQRIIENKSLTTAQFRDILKELATSVVATYPYWAVANWTNDANGQEAPVVTPGSASSAGAAPATQSQRVPAQSALRESKFQSTTRQ